MTSVSKDAKKGGFLCTVSWNINYVTIMENSMKAPQKLENYHMTQQIYFWLFILRI